MSDIVQHYDRNARGRDLVVGDIHGCFDQLRHALEDTGFDPVTDRLFSVGDLIDRGPLSVEALAWLDRPWFHACLGNHEDMALQSSSNSNILLGWVMVNGGEWWLGLDDAAREEYLAAFRQLPLAMEVDTTDGKVGIVHADIPERWNWPRFVEALESGDTLARETAVWSRQRADGLVTAPVEGIDQVVCGHTIAPDRRIHRCANVWFIDTGAFLSAARGGRLSLLPLNRLFHDFGSMGTGTHGAP